MVYRLTQLGNRNFLISAHNEIPLFSILMIIAFEWPKNPVNVWPTTILVHRDLAEKKFDLKRYFNFSPIITWAKYRTRKSLLNSLDILQTQREHFE